MSARGAFIGAVISGVFGATIAPPVARSIFEWIHPTPEQVAAAKQAEAERQEQQRARIAADAEARSAEIQAHLTSHPGCHFEDLGGYTTGEHKRYPVFAVFCPAERVTVMSSVGEDIERRSGRVTTHEHVEHPFAVSVDPTGDQPQ